MAYTLMNVAEAAYARTVGSVMPLFESFTVKDHNLAVDVIGEVLSRAQKSGVLTENVSEKIKDHLKNNYGKYALGAGALGAGAYAADQGYLGTDADRFVNDQMANVKNAFETVKNTVGYQGDTQTFFNQLVNKFQDTAHNAAAPYQQHESGQWVDSLLGKK